MRKIGCCTACKIKKSLCKKSGKGKRFKRRKRIRRGKYNPQTKADYLRMLYYMPDSFYDNMEKKNLQKTILS